MSRSHRRDSPWCQAAVALSVFHERNGTTYPGRIAGIGAGGGVDARGQSQAGPAAVVLTARRAGPATATRNRSLAAALPAQEKLREGAAVPARTRGGERPRKLPWACLNVKRET